MATLEIDDPEAQRLAALIAEQTGEPVTHVVTEALRDRFRRLPSLRTKATVEELRSLARRLSVLSEGVVPDHAALLYDERGLPK